MDEGCAPTQNGIQLGALQEGAGSISPTPKGNFNFNGNFTGNDFADFCSAMPASYEEDAVQIQRSLEQRFLAAYVQDNWRVNRRLTLNLGLRWDGTPHTYEANQQSANFYPNLYNRAKRLHSIQPETSAAAPQIPAARRSPGLGTSPNPILAGLQLYGTASASAARTESRKVWSTTTGRNFGPRIGFAYDLTGSGKTVVRGGFGIMYDRIQGNDMYNGATNTPFDASPTLHNVSLSNPGVQRQLTAIRSVPLHLPILPVGITGIRTQLQPAHQLSVQHRCSASVGTQGGVGYLLCWQPGPK